MIRAVIADDERAARSRIQKLLQGHDDIEVVAEAEGGREVVSAVRRHAPDLLFLDIQMPGMSGFDALEALLDHAVALPVVIFVTAYDEYAIQAFEARAVDYLLKPFDDDRFRRALDHVRRRLRERRSDRIRRQLEVLLEHARTEAAGPGPDLTPSGEPASSGRGASGGDPAASAPDDAVLPVHRRGRIALVEVAQIDWIEAAGDYVRLHVGDDTHLIRGSMHEVAEKVGAAFVRIHRSTIVRKNVVQELSPRTHGDYDVVLRGGTRLRLSRSYRTEVAEALGIEL